MQVGQGDELRGPPLHTWLSERIKIECWRVHMLTSGARVSGLQGLRYMCDGGHHNPLQASTHAAHVSRGPLAADVQCMQLAERRTLALARTTALGAKPRL